MDLQFFVGSQKSDELDDLIMFTIGQLSIHNCDNIIEFLIYNYHRYKISNWIIFLFKQITFKWGKVFHELKYICTKEKKVKS